MCSDSESRRRVIAGPQLHVGRPSGHQRAHRRAFEIDERRVAVGDRLRQRGFALLDAGARLIGDFRRDELSEHAVAKGFALGFVERGLIRLDDRIRLLEREPVSHGIDEE